MAKLEGSTTVVVGGKSDVDQKYCGTVGGQSTDFWTIDSEIKVCALHAWESLTEYRGRPRVSKKMQRRRLIW